MVVSRCEYINCRSRIVSYDHKRYCSGTCAYYARYCYKERKRGTLVLMLKSAEANVAKAKNALAALAKEAIERGFLSSDAVLHVEQEIRFEPEAIQNRANVTANRVKAFVVANTGAIRELLEAYCFQTGLGEFDRDQMWNKIVGNPRPILVPEAPSLTEFIDDEEEEEKGA